MKATPPTYPETTLDFAAHLAGLLRGLSTAVDEHALARIVDAWWVDGRISGEDREEFLATAHQLEGDLWSLVGHADAMREFFADNPEVQHAFHEHAYRKATERTDR